MYDAIYNVKIESWSESDYSYVPYLELEAGHFDYRQPESRHGWAPDFGYVYANPVKRVEDMEGDGCKLLAIDIYNPTIDIVFYPRLVIQGYVPRMCASKEPQIDHWYDDDTVYKYTPDEDPEWKGNHVKITVMPTALWQVEEQD